MNLPIVHVHLGNYEHMKLNALNVLDIQMIPKLHMNILTNTARIYGAFLFVIGIP